MNTIQERNEASSIIEYARQLRANTLKVLFKRIFEKRAVYEEQTNRLKGMLDSVCDDDTAASH